ncbi:copper resistance protein CopC [Corynebacterium hylobatis]|uniref:Copper resistance protein CopC n=1 Tax=Corynebacterium hylobatis TaxID=1859290 RepID=A0A3S0BGC2_9CORY|nr:copper resistance protein CopC [Corynebacterium hylobatis]
MPSVTVPRFRPFRTLTAATVVAAGLALSAPAALAHDVVIGGDPADNAVLQEFPDTISLEFSGYVKEDFNTLAISEAESGDVLFSGEPAIDGRWVSLDVPADIEPGAGEYRIGFQITSSDGHSTRGMTTFTVTGGEAAAGETTGTAAPATTADTTEVSNDPGAGESGLPEGPMAWVLAGVGVLAVLGVVIMMIARGRHNTQE